MKQVVGRVNNFVLYIDHYSQISDSISWDDVVLNPLAELPKVVSPVKLSEFYSNLPKKELDQGATSPCNADSTSVDTEDSEYADSDYDFKDGDDDLFVDNVDEEVVDVGSAKGKKAKKGKPPAGTSHGESSSPQHEDSSGLDGDLNLPDDSDGEGQVKLKFKSFNPDDLVNPTFKVGMVFSTVEVLRKNIREYSLKHRFDIRMPRNDRTRVGAHCAAGCPWTLYASNDSRTKAFMVRTYVGEHNCMKEWILKSYTAKWPSEKYTETFIADSKMTLGNFARIVQKDWNLTPSRSKLARAKRLTMDRIYGDELEQFNFLWDFGNELRRSNPGSTFYVGPNDGHFSHMYFSLDACKRGFLAGCSRHVIC
ncbi:uncharacterized protein LOC8080998 [Sorghum bicolor]|uniref:uncharacterized protein LOC8080998 n=1 Tax=Sorghum bicolor TaxID=4558 RepID=UPI000B424738|nr:uncharacterized protein LOC8080998 [Sorghum bicolor]XP_021308065.1 uncharacterized protein LOC8080998 [Sorghum bicolor]|eukprot:XP_021308064.1 uncharacterized protein LOC8080998 [Sorghum bicolor]